jgi:hypothetical protein
MLTLQRAADEEDPLRLFGSRNDGDRPQVVPPTGSGRNLRSAVDLDECLGVLDQVLVGYRPRKYRELPHVVEAAYSWHGPPHEAPARAVCYDENRDFLLIALWPRHEGTEFGIFPLSSGDARLTLTMVGHWKMRDPSLQSIGVYQAGLISLGPPAVTVDFFLDLLAAAGCPATPANFEAVGRQVSVMIKAQEIILKMDSKGAATRFAAGHRWPAGAAFAVTDVPNTMVYDLGGWNPWCPAVHPGSALAGVGRSYWRASTTPSGGSWSDDRSRPGPTSWASGDRADTRGFVSAGCTKHSRRLRSR